MEQITFERVWREAEKSDANYFSDRFALVMDSRQLGTKFIQVGQPYQEQGGRLMRVLAGECTYNINMQNYVIRPGHVLLVPDGSIVEVRGWSDGFSAQVANLLDMPTELSIHETICHRLSNLDNSRMGHYFQMMWEVCHRSALGDACQSKKPQYSLDTIRYLQMAMLNDLRNIQQTDTQNNPQQPLSRKEILTKGFMRLVNEHATREHRIQFYAEQMLLTPNHLSTVIKEQSGETPIYWINRAIILQAKVLLKHSDLKNFEIADRLNFPNASFFNKFFKAQTGMTPKEYQES